MDHILIFKASKNNKPMVINNQSNMPPSAQEPRHGLSTVLHHLYGKARYDSIYREVIKELINGEYIGLIRQKGKQHFVLERDRPGLEKRLLEKYETNRKKFTILHIEQTYGISRDQSAKISASLREMHDEKSQRGETLRTHSTKMGRGYQYENCPEVKAIIDSIMKDMVAKTRTVKMHRLEPQPITQAPELSDDRQAKWDAYLEEARRGICHIYQTTPRAQIKRRFSIHSLTLLDEPTPDYAFLLSRRQHDRINS